MVNHWILMMRSLRTIKRKKNPLSTEAELKLKIKLLATALSKYKFTEEELSRSLKYMNNIYTELGLKLSNE